MDNFTAGQKKAFKYICKKIKKKEKYITLKGYAGTGKTYLASYLYKHLLDEGHDLKVCAPTHKAAQVLNVKIGEPIACTIHSFLGLILRQDNKGGYRIQPHPMRQIPSNCIVLMDESSMIGKVLWQYIEETYNITWIFIGDPAQLPPVNEPDSYVFGIDGPELTDIVRQAKDNPIINLAWKVRQGQKYLSQDMTMDNNYFVSEAIKDFKKYKQESRILTYRNQTSNRYNRRIRAAIYGADAPRFVEGEWIVARETWAFKKFIQITNSEEVQIIDVCQTSIETYDRDWKVWVLNISNDNKLYALHESEYNEYEQELEELRFNALANPADWWKYYKLKEAFASIDYLYAMTTHKAQGSTFKAAYVDHEDLMCCQGKERRALVYVAITRPAEKLVMYI